MTDMSTDSTTPAAAPKPRALPANLTGTAILHDLMLYGGIYLTLWAGDLSAGGGWDALIAAAPVALSQLVRQILSGVS